MSTLDNEQQIIRVEAIYGVTPYSAAILHYSQEMAAGASILDIANQIHAAAQATARPGFTVAPSGWAVYQSDWLKYSFSQTASTSYAMTREATVDRLADVIDHGHVTSKMISTALTTLANGGNFHDVALQFMHAPGARLSATAGSNSSFITHLFADAHQTLTAAQLKADVYVLDNGIMNRADFAVMLADNPAEIKYAAAHPTSFGSHDTTTIMVATHT